MVARRHLLARHHRVAPALGPGRDDALGSIRREAAIGELRRGGRERRGDVEAPGVDRAGRDAAAGLGCPEIAADARIERRPVRIAPPWRGRFRFARRHRGGDRLARAEAWEDEAARLELVEASRVFDEVLRLPPHRFLPAQAEPGEVVIDRLLELGAAAGRVDVLDAQQEAPAGRGRKLRVEQRRVGVAEMKAAVRARREAENGLRHGCSPAIHGWISRRKSALSP